MANSRSWLKDQGSQDNYDNRTADANNDSINLGYSGAKELENSFADIIMRLNSFITNANGYNLAAGIQPNSAAISDTIQAVTDFATNNLLGATFAGAQKGLYKSAMQHIVSDLDNAIDGTKKMLEYLARVRAHVLALVELST
jgi:hypothetical protein